MQTFVVEARRSWNGPWVRVTTVQEDLVDYVADILADGIAPGEWQIRAEDSALRHPVAPPVETTRITRWDRLKWWAMFRFSRRARR